MTRVSDVHMYSVHMYNTRWSRPGRILEKFPTSASRAPTEWLGTPSSSSGCQILDRRVVNGRQMWNARDVQAAPVINCLVTASEHAVSHESHVRHTLTRLQCFTYMASKPGYCMFFGWTGTSFLPPESQATYWHVLYSSNSKSLPIDRTLASSEAWRFAQGAMRHP